MKLYPAIDLRGGKVVRLVQGDFDRELKYHDDPVSVASSFAEDGADWVHIVDLDGARTGEPLQSDTIERLVKTFPGLSFQVGGGVRSLEFAEYLFELGVSRVVLGSLWVKRPALARRIFRRFGPQVVAGIDCYDGRVATEGWTETSSIKAKDLVRQLSQEGLQHFVVTDIAHDGMMNGPALNLLAEVCEVPDAMIIASGGIRTLDDIKALQQVQGICGAIVGRAIYEGKFDLSAAIDLVRRKVP